jgi:hypothetical protein
VGKNERAVPASQSTEQKVLRAGHFARQAEMVLPRHGCLLGREAALGRQIRWDVPENVLKGLSFGGGYENRKGPINLFPNSPNRANVQQSYATADLFARYTTKIAGKDVVFSLNVRNITDETYMDKDSWYADPRNYTLTTRIKF